MPVKHEPFTPTKLEEDRVVQDVISVKLVGSERDYLEALKRYYRTPYDSTALKNAAFAVYKQGEELEKIRRKK